MTPADLLRLAGPILHGKVWQRELARSLGPYHPEGCKPHIDDRAVRRWASGTSNGRRRVPAWVLGATIEMLRRLALDVDGRDEAIAAIERYLREAI